MLRRLRPVTDKRVLVGPATRDDAAVYRLSKEQALVSTADFFTPVVDDPFTFGRIAAANALSDVYAMGAKPLFALSLVAFPLGELPGEILSRILEGAEEACQEAGIDVVGGHSIDDPEPKFGLAVTGLVHPRQVLTNAKARAGDLLVLTKPLGSGIATTALKRGLASEAIAAAVAQMSALNRAAGEVFQKAKVHALTDVTGFGLLGHLWNVCEASRVGARLFAAKVPVLPGVAELAQAGVVPGGTERNLEDVAPHVVFPASLPRWQRLVFADAQTNGGLLAAVAAKDVEKLLRALARRKVMGSVIGVIEPGPAQIRVEHS